MTPFHDSVRRVPSPFSPRPWLQVPGEPPPPGSPSSSTVGPVSMPRRFPQIVRYCLLVFTASIPLKAMDLGFLRGPLSPARLAGVLFFGSCAWFLPRRFFSRPSPAVWCFIGYLVVYVIEGAFISSELRGAFKAHLITMIQLMALLWIVSKLMKSEVLLRQTLVVFASACGFLAIAVLLGLPGFSVSLKSSMGERASVLGFNPNDVAATMALALIIWMGLALSPGALRGWARICALVCPLPAIALMVRTGSRGGMAAFVFGVSIFLLPLGRSRRRMVAVLVGIVAINGLVYMVLRDPVTMRRWTLTLETGNTAKRDEIFSSAVQMIYDRPFQGWLPVECVWELGARTNSPWGVMDAHNLFLHVFMEVGLLGGVPFMLGMWICTKSAWRARLGKFGVLALSLLLTLVAINLSGTGIAVKSLWLFLGMVLGTGWSLPSMRRPTPQAKPVRASA